MAGKVLVFDWDDTVYPTNFIKQLVAESEAASTNVTHNPDWQQFVLTVEAAGEFVEFLASSGAVCVTAATPGWIQQCFRFMESHNIGSKLIATMQTIQQFPRLQASSTAHKAGVFKDISASACSLTSVGDGRHELDAACALKGKLQGGVKHIQLAERPDGEAMMAQFQKMSKILLPLMNIDEDLISHIGMVPSKLRQYNNRKAARLAELRAAQQRIRRARDAAVRKEEVAKKVDIEQKRRGAKALTPNRKRLTNRIYAVRKAIKNCKAPLKLVELQKDLNRLVAQRDSL